MSEQFVYIVDDDAAVRDSMAALIALHGFRARQFAGAREFLAASAGLAQGCIVLDIRMPEISGIELQRELARVGRNHAIIFVTGHGDIEQAVLAMKAGARDFLEKPFDDATLIAAIRQALASPSPPSQMHARAATALARLTEREREILALVVNGLTSRAIADTLGISVRTVEIHRGNLLAKTESQNVAQLVRIAIAGGLDSSAGPRAARGPG